MNVRVSVGVYRHVPCFVEGAQAVTFPVSPPSFGQSVYSVGKTGKRATEWEHKKRKHVFLALLLIPSVASPPLLLVPLLSFLSLSPFRLMCLSTYSPLSPIPILLQVTHSPTKTCIYTHTSCDVLCFETRTMNVCVNVQCMRVCLRIFNQSVCLSLMQFFKTSSIPELPSMAVDAPTRQSMLKINKITFYEVQYNQLFEQIFVQTIYVQFETKLISSRWFCRLWVKIGLYMWHCI